MWLMLETNIYILSRCYNVSVLHRHRLYYSGLIQVTKSAQTCVIPGFVASFFKNSTTCILRLLSFKLKNTLFLFLWCFSCRFLRKYFYSNSTIYRLLSFFKSINFPFPLMVYFPIVLKNVLSVISNCNDDSCDINSIGMHI